jgi:hypothetical protein
MTGGSRPVCELCEAVPFTRQFFRDDVCWIAECESCDVPMVVWNHHGAEPPEEAVAHMLERLGEVGEEVLGREKGAMWFIDRHMRQIPDHFHAHARIDRWNTPR